MNVHYLQHVPFEGLGYIETWLTENNHIISATRFYEQDYCLPAIEEIDALIILGGPMGVYDEHQYPSLQREKVFIEEFIRTNKKVLGICLGAQLMAVCLGAKVYKAVNKEIGWYTITPTEECKGIPWFYDLFKNNPTVFHWHGDKFQIPCNGSINLLSSEANNNQAFYHNENVIGLQFHLEVTGPSLTQMLLNGLHELKEKPYIQNVQQIKNGQKNIEICNNIMADILRNWLTGDE